MQFLVLLNPLIIGYISFHIIKGMFGDGPSGRILAVLGFIVCAVLYFLLSYWVLIENYSMFWGILLTFGPIILVLIVMLLVYVSSGNKSNN